MSSLKSFISNSPKLMEFIRFGITGVISTLSIYGIYYLLLYWLNASVSYSIGYVVAFIINYLMTTKFTFKVKASKKNGVGFIVSNIINYVMNIVLLNLFIYVGVSESLAPIPMFAICIPTNFIVVRFVMRKQ